MSDEAVCYETTRGRSVVYKGKLYPFGHNITLDGFFGKNYASIDLRPELVQDCPVVWRGFNPDERILT